MTPVAGVDGCRAGWIVLHDGCATVHPDFAAVLAALPYDAVVAVDIPIGLIDEHVAGGREVDRAARVELGPKRSSVFSAPPRYALAARTLPDARRRGARLTLQTLNLLPRIEDVDGVMTPELQSRVFEVHPELSFAAMAGGSPVLTPKRTAAGDDLLDACALAWSARRVADGTASSLPHPPSLDARGLSMELHW